MYKIISILGARPQFIKAQHVSNQENIVSTEHYIFIPGTI